MGSFFRPVTSHNIDVPKRKRLSGPKVRTGCLTCKKRHVKCDEKKPKCERCEKAFIQCDGYAGAEDLRPAKVEPPPPPPNTKGRPILPRPRAAEQTATELESPPLTPIQALSLYGTLQGNDTMYFDLFQHRLVRDLSGFHRSNFWSRTVLQGMMTDECVRHSVLAIGALSQGLYHASNPGDGDSPGPPNVVAHRVQSVLNEHHQAALHHHTKAVAMFRQRIEGNSSKITPRATMIATILFVAFEFLQGNIQAADSLITSGLLLLKDSVSIIQGAKRRRRPKTLTKMEKLQRTFDDGMDELEYLLPRLSAVTGFSAFCIAQHDPVRELLPATAAVDFPEAGFTTFERATQMWSELEPRALMFVARHLSKNLRNIPFDAAQAQREQAEFLVLLYQWRELFEGYARSFAEQSSAGLAGVGVQQLKQCVISGQEQLRELRMLQIHCLLQIIFTSCCLDHTALAFDGFAAEYRELLDRCRAFLADQPNQIGFTLDFGVIPTLAFIISTCRAHDLRAEALALCQSIEWREGAWDARVEAVGKMGQMALEESGMDASGFIPPDSRYHWTMGTWDMAQQKLIAEYTRFTPDEFGLPVQVTVALDVI